MYFPKVLKPRPILFDVGDTLLNFCATNPLPYFEEGARLAYEFIAQRRQRSGVEPAWPVDLPPFKKYFGVCRRRYLWALVVAAVRRREVDTYSALFRLLDSLSLPTDREFVLAVGERFYEPMRRLGTAEEGAGAVLDALMQHGHPLGIVSNTNVPGPVLDRHLEQADLLKYFPVRVYSCDVGVRKPHPSMFLTALRALNIKPQNTLFVGDKPALDIKGAKRVGMITVLKVGQGRPPSRRSRLYPLRGRHGADYVIRHLTELPGLLEQISPRCYERPPLLARDELEAWSVKREARSVDSASRGPSSSL